MSRFDDLPEHARHDIRASYESWYDFFDRNTIGDVRHEARCLLAAWLDAEVRYYKERAEAMEGYRAAQQASVNVVNAALAGAELARREERE